MLYAPDFLISLGKLIQRRGLKFPLVTACELFQVLVKILPSKCISSAQDTGAAKR